MQGLGKILEHLVDVSKQSCASVASGGGGSGGGRSKKVVAVLNQDDVELEQKQLPPNVRTIAVSDCTTADAIPDEVLNDADVVLVWRDPVLDAAALRKFRRLRAVVRIGVGVDSVDLAAAGELGIAVCNVPAYGTEEVADSAMAHLLNLYRRTARIASLVAGAAHTSTVNADTAAAMAASFGPAASKAPPVRRIRGQKLGLVGLGRIGTAVAHRAHAFGFDVSFYDPFAIDGLERAVGASWLTRHESLEALLTKSDAISLHVTLTPSTKHLIDGTALRMMKHGAYLVNTARGGLVDDTALAAALADGSVGGAGLDCMEGEPRLENTIAAKMGELPSLLVTPHSAFYSLESVCVVVAQYHTIKMASRFRTAPSQLH
eukprot:SAG31_NODE_5823_length_2308_cov_1.091444_3_plen_375_part_00